MDTYQIRQLTDVIEFPESGKKSVVLADDQQVKVILFAFAAGDGLAEHVAPAPAVIQVIQGTGSLTVGSEAVDGQPGTWIQMAPQTPHSIHATTPLLLLLTLIK